MAEKLFRVYRPLIFLCGPKYDATNPHDRRKVLFDYIRLKSEPLFKGKKTKFALVPVIVDQIFSDNLTIVKYNLDLRILEEFIASISYQTYIFLDSLSTSFEYGLFDNGIKNNKSVVLLEDDYDQRDRRGVGDYLINSINNSGELIIYNSFKKDKKEFISFRIGGDGKPIIPDAIKNHIDDTFIKLKSRAQEGTRLYFLSTNEKEQIDKRTRNKRTIEYSYSQDFNSISFKIDIGVAFYLFVMSTSNKTIKKMAESGNYDSGFMNYKKYIFNIFIESCLHNDEINTAALIIKNPTINLEIDKYQDSLNSFKHFAYISERITSFLGNSFRNTVTSLRSNREFKATFNGVNNYNFTERLFGIDSKDKALINDYEKNQMDYVERTVLKISGKNRQIIQYKNNHKGRHLKRLHERIMKTVTLLFPPSEYAFAYKKESCTKMCIEQHLDSNCFVKLDVHSFFNSLKLKSVCSALKKRIDRSTNKEYAPITARLKQIIQILKCCFYNGHLPLGFVTSPALSDIYMNTFDNKIGSEFQAVKYTRYADDMLISSKKKNKFLAECEAMIIDELSALHLEINGSKRVKVALKNNGDSIRFLGINVVKRENGKELTISKTNLYDFAKRIHKEKHKRHPDLSVIKGIINYVKSISIKSYEHLCKSYLAMFKETI